MKLRKILVGRVFNWDKYEDLRISFEIEIENHENEHQIVLEAFETLEKINHVILWFKNLREQMSSLETYVKGYKVFEKWANEYNEEIGKKIRVLKCLEDAKTIPLTCKEVSGIPIDQIEDRKKMLKEEIEILRKKADKIEQLEERYTTFLEFYDQEVKKFKDNFMKRNLDKCEIIIDGLLKEIEDLFDQIKSLKPKSYW